MATVFLARDVKHDRRVAMKVLHAELAAVVGAERFLQEIKIVANLQHPHILGLIDSGLIDADESGSRPFYVMPYIEGESLRQRLDRETQLPVSDTVRIATEIASALDYAHRHGVIHRDIKPENVLLHDGSAIVADFGIALAVSHAGGDRLTQTGVSLGTPAYMSPEQASGERVITQRSDIYSLGVVTYEMLAGEPPFTGSTARVIVARVMTEEPRSLNTVRRHLPAHVSLAVARALEKTPADRFASAHEFAEALTNPAVMLSGTPLTSTPGRSARWTRPALYGGGVLAALLLATAAWSRMHPADTRPVLRYDLTFDSSEAIAPGGSYVTRIALSPDARRLAYIGGTRAQLLIRPRNQLHATALAGTEGATSPFFSPDGQRVGALTEGAVHLISLNGGEPITLKSDLIGVAGASWARDSFIYVDGRGLEALLRLEAKAGAPVQHFTSLDEASHEIDHTWPDVLPNGKGVVFTVTRAANNVSDVGRTYFIAVAEIPSGKHRIIVNDAMFARYAASGHLLYVTTDRRLMVVPFDQNSMTVSGEPTMLAESMRLGSFGSADLIVSPTGTLIYGTGASEGKPDFVWVGRDGKAELFDSTWRGFFWNPAISPDGTQLVAEQNIDGGNSIWIKRLDRGAAVRLTFENNLIGAATWTPDGRALTFGSIVGASPGLWTKRADGNAQASLVFRDKRGMRAPRWSPDGRWLVFTTFPGQPGAGDIVGARPGVDTVAVPLVASRFTENAPNFSPDGKYLAYTSDESGREEVYVVPFPKTDAAKWQVSTRGGTEPVWSHSGKELFYRNADADMVAVSVETTLTFSIRSATTLFPTANFRANSDFAQYAVSADDRRFLMIRNSAPNTAERLVVVENWFQELARK